MKSEFYPYMEMSKTIKFGDRLRKSRKKIWRESD
jgi:hypothetical protein